MTAEPRIYLGQSERYNLITSREMPPAARLDASTAQDRGVPPQVRSGIEHSHAPPPHGYFHGYVRSREPRFEHVRNGV